MCKITSIKRQMKNKNRVSIFVDGEYFGSLDEKTFMESGLKSGDALNQEKWQVISEQGENQSAFNKGISYISRLMRSKKQVVDYLKKKGYEEPAIKYATNKMAEYKYIDDTAYAKMILSHQVNVKKVGLISAKVSLKKNGIAKEIIEETILEYSESEQMENAKYHYQKLLKKYRNEEDNQKKKNKISQAMARRGFSWEMIKSVSQNYYESS